MPRPLKTACDGSVFRTKYERFYPKRTAKHASFSHSIRVSMSLACTGERLPMLKPGILYPPTAPTMRAIGADATATGVYVVKGEGNSVRGIYRLDAAKGTLGDCLYSDDTYTLKDAAPLYSRRTNALVGLRYTRDVLSNVWLSDGFQARQAELDSRLPGANNDILGWNDAESVFLVRSTRGGQEETLYLFVPSQSNLIRIAGGVHWIPRPTYARTEQIVLGPGKDMRCARFLPSPAPLSQPNEFRWSY